MSLRPKNPPCAWTYWEVSWDVTQATLTASINITICFTVLLGLVFMGRHKCEAVACLSSQVKCNFMNFYIVHFIYGE